MKKLNTLLAFATLLLVVFANIGCEALNSSTDEEGEEQEETTESIEGLWKLEQGEGDLLYVLIGSETITVYETEAGLECYYVMVLDITSVDDDVYTLFSEDEGEEQQLSIVRTGNQLDVTFINGEEEFSETFTLSDEGAESLSPVCEETIEGVWQLDSQEGNILYVHFEDNLFTVYDYQGDFQQTDCYYIIRFIITDVDGNTYTIQEEANPESTQEVIIVNHGDELEVTRQEGENEVNETYYRSEADVGSFVPECSEE